MSKGYLFNRLNQLKGLIQDYVYPDALPIYLKQYFQQNKHLGSKDRKQIKHWFYLYFKSDIPLPDIEKELIALLLQDKSDLFARLKSMVDPDKKDINTNFKFPLIEQISPGLSKEQRDNLKSEKLFWVRTHLKPEATIVDTFSEDVYGLEQGVNLAPSNLLQIQDRSSYEACFKMVQQLGVNPMNVWDVCAGAGGKSIALMDLASREKKKVTLFTSDLRPQMVKTIIKRMKDAGHSEFKHTLVDLSKPVNGLKFIEQEVGSGFFDAIIIDAPCSGSGTWGRNAQHLRYFEQGHLDAYITLQKNIVSHSLKFLKKGGSLFYLTCSVFDNENEKQVQYFTNNLGLNLITEEYLGNKNSDVLYYSHLRY